MGTSVRDLATKFKRRPESVWFLVGHANLHHLRRSRSAAKPADLSDVNTHGLDIVEGQNPQQPGQGEARSTAAQRPFLMVTFSCANAYQRVYRSIDGTHYLARCPKCAKTMRFEVGQAGSAQRHFTLSC